MRVVVVGGGLAAASAVAELREAGHEGEVVLLGAEPHLPYERPPLSKEVLLRTRAPESARVHDEQWYAEHGVELWLGCRATALEPERRRVRTTQGEVGYDRLLLATGSEPRRLPVADDSGAPVTYLRTLEDARALDAALAAGARLVVIGAGWIGLEVAAAARERGSDVVVVEQAPLPLHAVLGPELGEVFAGLHREHGVDLRLGARVEKVEGGGGGARVSLADGGTVEADLVVVGIGARPADDLARAGGLACDDGVLVDAALRTSDPAVLAAGDVASQDHPRLGRVRVEHWDTAVHQGRAAARTMLGEDAPYTRAPYFFTDQYDVGMEYVGHVGPRGYDRVVVAGDPAARRLTARYVRDGVVVAGLHLNDWDAIDALREGLGRPVP